MMLRVCLLFGVGGFGWFTWGLLWVWSPGFGLGVAWCLLLRWCVLYLVSGLSFLGLMFLSLVDLVILLLYGVLHCLGFV